LIEHCHGLPEKKTKNAKKRKEKNARPEVFFCFFKVAPDSKEERKGRLEFEPYGKSLKNPAGTQVLEKKRSVVWSSACRLPGA